MRPLYDARLRRPWPRRSRARRVPAMRPQRAANGGDAIDGRVAVLHGHPGPAASDAMPRVRRAPSRRYLDPVGISMSDVQTEAIRTWDRAMLETIASGTGVPAGLTHPSEVGPARAELLRRDRE